jgi:hypothetical protein
VKNRFAFIQATPALTAPAWRCVPGREPYVPRSTPFCRKRTSSLCGPRVVWPRAMLLLRPINRLSRNPRRMRSRQTIRFYR